MNKMKKLKNDYCIRLFVETDNLRPQMMNVSEKDGYLYSSNGYMIAKIKSDLCGHKYESVENFPNAESILQNHVSVEKKKFLVENLFTDLVKIEVCFKPKMVDCDECGGDGTCICDYCDSEHECKQCGGTGEVKGEGLELSGEHDCKLFGKYYRLHFLDLILRTAIITGVKEIEISNSEGLGGTIFYVGDFIIYLCVLNKN